jgi:hypothetical protein
MRRMLRVIARLNGKLEALQGSGQTRSASAMHAMSLW